MNKEHKTILLNQLRIMSAMQRLEYFVHQQEIEDDLSEGIKDTQRFLTEGLLYNDIFMRKENTNLKQALNEIRKILNECKMLMPHEFDWEEQADYILQIIDKVGGNDDN